MSSDSVFGDSSVGLKSIDLVYFEDSRTEHNAERLSQMTEWAKPSWFVDMGHLET